MLSIDFAAFACRRCAWTLPKAPEVAKVIKQFPLSPPENESSAKTAGRSRSKQLTADTFKIAPGRISAVTTILSQTRSPQEIASLEKWKKRKIIELGGEKEFYDYSEDMKSFSSTCHAMVKHCVENGFETEDFFSKEQRQRNVLSQFKQIKSRITTISHCEHLVNHSLLGYRGKIDCVMEVSGLRLVADWKIPDNPNRRRLGINDCHLSELLQGVAYLGAINHSRMFDKPLDGFALVYLYQHDETPPDAHVVLGKDCNAYWAVWVEKVKQFYTEQIQ